MGQEEITQGDLPNVIASEGSGPHEQPQHDISFKKELLQTWRAWF